MKYKEFVAWCNDRACDGCWSMATAIYCLEIGRKINALPFWKREKSWQEISEVVEREIISVINKKIAEVRNG